MAGVPKDLLKLARPFPLIGQAAALAAARETLNEKGATLGAVDIALDLLPIVGRMKGLFELFGGEVLSEKNLRQGFSTIRKAVDQLENICEDEIKKNSGVNARTSENRSSNTEEIEEPRHYPENSAKLAALRARAATRPVYEKRPDNEDVLANANSDA